MCLRLANRFGRVLARRAAELGGEVLLEPTPEVREGTLALVTDPAGAVLALQKTTG